MSTHGVGERDGAWNSALYWSTFIPGDMNRWTAIRKVGSFMEFQCFRNLFVLLCCLFLSFLFSPCCPLLCLETLFFHVPTFILYLSLHLFIWLFSAPCFEDDEDLECWNQKYVNGTVPGSCNLRLSRGLKILDYKLHSALPREGEIRNSILCIVQYFYYFLSCLLGMFLHCVNYIT